VIMFLFLFCSNIYKIINCSISTMTKNKMLSNVVATGLSGLLFLGSADKAMGANYFFGELSKGDRSENMIAIEKSGEIYGLVSQNLSEYMDAVTLAPGLSLKEVSKNDVLSFFNKRDNLESELRSLGYDSDLPDEGVISVKDGCIVLAYDKAGYEPVASFFGAKLSLVEKDSEKMSPKRYFFIDSDKDTLKSFVETYKKENKTSESTIDKFKQTQGNFNANLYLSHLIAIGLRY